MHGPSTIHWFTCSLLDAQSCVDTVNVQQRGTDELRSNSYVIVPRNNFSCNGRITGFMASLNQYGRFCENPSIIVWQPMNTERTLYNIRDSYTLNNSHVNAMGDYYFANVSFTGNNRIEFQSGDVIGYWHRSRVSCYRVWNIRTAGYTSYAVRPTLNNTINTNEIDGDFAIETTDRQPLIQVTFGNTHVATTPNIQYVIQIYFIDIQCNNLTAPTNGKIMSCSSGRVGVGYEGDTCSFTCNTGYELTGSDTRTCQSDGSWSGSYNVCRGGKYNLKLCELI